LIFLTACNASQPIATATIQPASTDQPTPTATETPIPPTETPTPWPTPPAKSSALIVRFNFPGVEMDRVYGPDPSLAAGENVIVVSTNEFTAIYRKDGSRLAIVGLDNFFFSLKQPGEDVIFDPRIVYDHWSQRFFLFARAKVPDPNCKITECKAQLYIAVSKTKKPTTFFSDDWHRYALDATLDLTSEGPIYTQAWPDFTSMGVSPETLVVTLVMLNRVNGAYEYQRIRILNKEVLLQGGPVEVWHDLKLSAHSRQAVIHLDNPQGNFFLVETNDDSPCVFKIHRITNPIQAPQIVQSSVATKSCRSGIKVPQPGGSASGDGPSVNVGGLSDRPVFRNGSIWVVQDSAQYQDGIVRSGILFAQLDVSNWPQVKVIQSIVISQPGYWYFMPSITVNEQSNVAIVFACTDGVVPISVCYSGRLGTDPLNTMRPVTTMKVGIAYVPSNSGCPPQRNWGDYFGAALDPVDGSAWIIGEYAKGSCWATWVGNLDWSVSSSP